MINVLIVDDSAVVRQVLSRELAKADDIRVIGTAPDPFIARDKIVALKPDVVTLDMEMPRMDGMTFLSKLMTHFPLPVIVVSSLTPQGSETAMRALELGAVDVVCKPGSSFSVADLSDLLIKKIRVAAKVKSLKHTAPCEHRVAAARASGDRLGATTHKILAIGASTGGTRAISNVLTHLPVNTPGTVIVQHMPEHFTAAFAERLNGICVMEVREARHNDMVVPGLALIAPGNRHMALVRNGARYHVRLNDGPPVHHQRPAVDVLFQSVARHAGANSVGVILTGMGADGAVGLEAMHEAGAHTIAQNEETCVVFGMPKEAIKLGAADEIRSLNSIPHAILDALAEKVEST